MSSGAEEGPKAATATVEADFDHSFTKPPLNPFEKWIEKVEVSPKRPGLGLFAVLLQPESVPTNP